MKDGMHYSDLDLNMVLTQDELVEFARYTPTENYERCHTTTGWCYIHTNCYRIYCWTQYGVC